MSISHIQGVTSSSCVDYSGMLSYVIYMGGCNFNCYFCHNRGVGLYQHPEISFDEVLAEVDKKKEYIDAIVFSGGEPLIHAPLILSYINRLLAIKNFKIKLFTNGYEWEKLASLINRLDAVDLSIKDAPKKYANYCTFEKSSIMCQDPIESIKLSVHLLKRRKHINPVFDFKINIVDHPQLDEDAKGLIDLYADLFELDKKVFYVLPCIRRG